METFSNQFGKIALYKTNMKGLNVDYIIHFCNEQTEIGTIIEDTYQLVKYLFEKYNAKTVKGRIVAKVQYQRIKDGQITDDNIVVFFPSYGAEIVTEPHHFFERHMFKIAERMDMFHKNGSNLILYKIDCLHVDLSIL